MRYTYSSVSLALFSLSLNSRLFVLFSFIYLIIISLYLNIKSLPSNLIRISVLRYSTEAIVCFPVPLELKLKLEPAEILRGRTTPLDTMV